MYLQGFYLILGLFTLFNYHFSLPEILKQVVVDTKACANNSFNILTHPLPLLLPQPPLTAIISHISLRVVKHYYLKSAGALEVGFGESFSEGIIKPYEGTSLMIGKVRLVHYLFASFCFTKESWFAF